MPLYRCSQCNAVENTAVANYWVRGDTPPLCSECDPEIGTWHQLFQKQDADEAGYEEGPDGFLIRRVPK